MSRALQSIADSINADIASKSSMKVGAIINHPDGYRVKVISGQFLSNGRVSNWWTWRRVSKGGILGRLVSGYGW